jgi:hypothetical protein
MTVNNRELKRKNVKLIETKIKTKGKSSGIEQRTVTRTTTTTPMMMIMMMMTTMITIALVMRRLTVVLLKMVTITSMIKICFYPQYFILHRLSLKRQGRLWKFM